MKDLESLTDFCLSLPRASHLRFPRLPPGYRVHYAYLTLPYLLPFFLSSFFLALHPPSSNLQPPTAHLHRQLNRFLRLPL
jgi:hypothetical protein